MKAQSIGGKKLGKRIYTLKELAQRDFLVTPKDPMENITSTVSLVHIQEDLLDESTYGEITYGERAHEESTYGEIASGEINQALSPAAGNKSQPQAEKSKKIQQNPSHINLTLSIELLTQLIEKEVAHTAKQLNIEAAELQAWINLQVMAPKQTLLALLRLSRANHLDPLKEEVALALYEDGHLQAYITVEGYSKMLNCHPAFNGIAFTESPETANGIPIWMECTIYRKDRGLPIVIREYFEEVKGEQAIWQKMPRRMLRHRTLQQCARLAMG